MLGLAASVTTEDPMWVKTRACRLCRPGAPSIIEQTQGKTLLTKQIAGKGGGDARPGLPAGSQTAFLKHSGRGEPGATALFRRPWAPREAAVSDPLFGDWCQANQR